MFFVIGLGLGSIDDITVKGLNAVKSCDKLYLENYTSILIDGHDNLESLYGRDVTLATREMVEDGGDSILEEARHQNVGFLVVGDPFGATTHLDLMLRAKKMNIPCQVIHNASILNAIGCCGLQLYSFGETVSIPFWTDSWQPESYFPRICSNFKNGLHTLCLLDIKVREPTLESLTKKKREYMPARFMTVAEAAQQLIATIDRQTDDQLRGINVNSFAVGVARVGSTTQKIVFGTLKQLVHVDFGKPLHSLVICGKLSELEEEYLQQFK